jgi:very-short-patch-repair endonuclease
MKQVSKKKPVVKKRTVRKTVRSHPKYGTSKLEEDFARDFLDKLGFKYIYQFEAKDIGRFYDFCILLKEENGLVPGNIILIEIDGGYYHSDPRVVNENKLNPMQKHNKRVDEHKNKWALMHGIPLIRIWEKDIREKPNKVLEALKKILYATDNKAMLTEKKNKRHINKIK